MKQNDKIDMTGTTMPSYMAPSPIKNDTRIGGHAMKRVCSYRMTMMKLGDIRQKAGNKTVYGHHIRMMMIKNSYGPRDRQCEFSVYFDEYDDKPGYQAPGFSYADRTCAWMSSRKFLGTTVENELYTCDALGCVAVPAEQMYAALLANEEHLGYMGSVLGIEGYDREIRHIDPTVDAGVVDEEDDAPVVPDDDGPPPVVPDDDGPPPVVPDDEGGGIWDSPEANALMAGIEADHSTVTSDAEA